MSIPVFGSQDDVESFLYSCALGNAKNISFLIRSGVLIDVEDKSGNTGLQIASAAGHMNVVEILSQSGASVNKCNSYGWSALHQAGSAGHLPIVQFLLTHNADPTLKTKFGQSVLSLAAASGHKQILNFLLSKDVDWESVESVVSNGICSFNSALASCAQGKAEILSILLNYSAALINSTVNITGTTALMMASAYGDRETCQVLLDRDVDLSVKDCAGRTVSFYAGMLGHHFCLTNDSDFVQEATLFYYEDDTGGMDVFDALKDDDIEMMSKILSAAPSLTNKETIDGNRTLLIEAASSKNSKALKLLITIGATVNHQASNSGRTAISHAIENCFEEGIYELLDACADPTIKDISGKLPLDYMSHQLNLYSQPVIKRLCYAGLLVIAPELTEFVNEKNISSLTKKTGASGKTLFGRLKSKLSGKNSKKPVLVSNSTRDIFAFPCSSPLNFDNSSSAKGLLELEPVRVEPTSPPFDRRKMIWTDGAHADDSTGSVPPLSPSVKNAETLPPGNSVFTRRPVRIKKSEVHKPRMTLGSFPSGDDSTSDESELKGYLRNADLVHYEPLLKNNEINDLTTFKLLNERDLSDLNVGTMDRLSLIQAITKAKNLPK